MLYTGNRMETNYSIQKKLLISILSTILILVGGCAIFTISYINELTKNKIFADVLSLAKSKADEIRTFF